MTNNNNLIIPKENKAQIVEIRYLENQETLTHKFFKKILPTAYCMSDNEEKQMEGMKQIIGTTIDGVAVAKPELGIPLIVSSKIVGNVGEGVGKVTGIKEMEDGARTVKESAEQPLKDIEKGVKEIFE